MTEPDPQSDPLNILVVLSEFDPSAAEIVHAARGHYTLFCVRTLQALEAVDRGFIPDVVIIDGRLADATELVDQLLIHLSEHELIFVGLFSSSQCDLFARFIFRCTFPVVASELEQILSQMPRLHGCNSIQSIKERMGSNTPAAEREPNKSLRFV